MREMKLLGLISALLMFTACSGSANKPSVQSSSLANKTFAKVASSKKSAFTYIESRAHEWVTERGCVSCHTVLPYAIGNMRSGATSAVAYQDILKLVTTRTQTFETSDPWYGDSRALQSKATESVLNAFILTQADTAQKLKTPSDITKLAFEKLKSQQSADGSWLWLDFEMEPWESVAATPYGASLAAVAFARSPLRTDPNYASVVQKIKTYLHTAHQDQTITLWSNISILWAESELGGILTSDEFSSILSDLISKQLPSGGWSMNHLGNWQKQGTQLAAGDMNADGYASAYLTYVLRKALASGRVPKALNKNVTSAYKSGIDWLLKNQNIQGYWESASLTVDDPYNQSLVEDAAAGFALGVLGN